jgi:nicotinate-nucleotide pyrophosphorylase (carboxylating)
MREFAQITWDAPLRDDCRALLALALREDLGGADDWTSSALVPAQAIGRAEVVARRAGIVAGLPAVELLVEMVDARLGWLPAAGDGDPIEPGARIAQIEGPARSLLRAERPMLNLLGRLSGIATLTRQFVEAVSGTKARVYDTRKTTPGWRRLEKYAVRCGGGRNHRTGLFDAVLIKDNHLALGADATDSAARYTPAEAVARAREFVRQRLPQPAADRVIVEVEVDTLDQLDDVLPAEPDVVLLDNMTLDELREAVRRRDARGFGAELEASGGVSLATIGAMASTGVERISVGALTHSAVCLDFGLDWLARGP